MAVRRPNHAELVGVRAELLLEDKPVLQRLACVFALQHVVLLEGREVKVALVQGLVVGKFVGGRQKRMCFTVTFYLGHLVERFPLGTQFHIVLVHLAAGIGLNHGEHPAVGEVAVMCQRNCLAACPGLVVLQPFIKVERIRGSQGRLSGQRHHLTRPGPVVTQDHVAMQIVAFGDRRPFKTD